MEEKKQTQKKEICQYSKRCGGCAFQGMSYEEQLEQKQKTVKKYLKKYVKPECIIPIITGTRLQLHLDDYAMEPLFRELMKRERIVLFQSKAV